MISALANAANRFLESVELKLDIVNVKKHKCSKIVMTRPLMQCIDISRPATSKSKELPSLATVPALQLA